MTVVRAMYIRDNKGSMQVTWVWAVTAICCGSKKSSKLLFLQNNYVNGCHGDMTTYGQDFTKVNHSKLTLLHAMTFLLAR